MRVLSLFDGISCARVALERAGLQVTAYYACEVDKYAIKVSQKNYPDIVHLGDVRTADLPEGIDLLIGGSPCQDLSIAKKDRRGLEGDRSGLFWEYVRILRHLKPKWFVLENVASMPKKDKDIITAEMGVEPVLFDASLVSAQSRRRLFWTNIPFTLPSDRGIMLRDILQPDAEVDESMVIQKPFVPTPTKEANGRERGGFVQIGYLGAENACKVGGQALRVYDPDAKAPTSGVGLVFAGYVEGGVRKGLEGQEHLSRAHRNPNRVYDPEGKAPTLSASETSGRNLIKLGHVGDKDHQAGRVYSDQGKAPTQCRGPGGGALPTLIATMSDARIRKLTPIECERLQGLPDNYTDNVAKTHRYKCVGNAFNVDVVAHILTQVS